MVKKNGFTLIELMIAVAIIGLLMVVATPSYTKSVQRTARSEAVGKVLQLASSLAKVKVVTMTYSAADGETNHTDHYYIEVSLDSGGGYLIIAKPIKSQNSDRCGTMTYYSNGLWEFSNGHTYDECVG